MRGIGMFASSFLLLFSAQVFSAPAGHLLTAGSTETVLALRPLIDMPEGIAIDSRGHIFIGNRRLENDTRVSEILEIERDGAATVFATLDPAVVDEFAAGVLGLAFDSRGDLYAAVASSNPRTHGVWRIRRGGESERLPGSKRMILPDAIAVDAHSDVYVTDATDGAIWRFPQEGRGHVWVRHPLLAPDPAFGANGIAFVPPNNLYVANTDRALIARVRILPDGTPSEPEIAATGFELLGIDGLAADERGMLHAVIVVSAALGTSPLVEVDPETGKITPLAADASPFDLPTSLAFGRGPLDHKSVYVVNSGIFPEERPEAAPGVVRVAVGVPGSSAVNQAALVVGPGELIFSDGLTPIQVTEAATVIHASVRRINGSTGAVSVDYSTVSGTAKAGSDFTTATGTLTWADGDMASKAIAVTIHNDTAMESAEDFQIRIKNPTGSATIPILGDIQLVRILDDGDTSSGGGGGGGGGGAIDYLAMLFLVTLIFLRRYPVAHQVFGDRLQPAQSCMQIRNPRIEVRRRLPHRPRYRWDSHGQ